MRQRISDKNIFPCFDLETEYKKLHELFFDRSEFGLLVGPLKDSKAHPSLSYNDCLQAMFLDWDLRGSFTSLEEMLLGLQIGEDYFAKSCTEDRLLDYIQFLFNAVIFVREEVRSRQYTIYQASESICKAIVENCHMIMDRLGAEVVDEDGEFVVIYKNDSANAVATQHPDISSSIRDYLKIDNRGDLERKGEILCILAKELESNEGRFKRTEFNTLCSDTTMLLNKMGVRHALDSRDRMSRDAKSAKNVSR